MWVVQGIWGGMIGGTCLQTLILIGITASRNWEKEVSFFYLLFLNFL